MKDITHYFADLPRKAESAPTSGKEVKAERAKIVEATAPATATAEPARSKRKRGRVKIKISRSSAEGAVCDILSSSTDLVDKTPSPYEKKSKKRLKCSDDSPLTKSNARSSSEPGDQDIVLPNKRRRNGCTSEDVKQVEQFIPKEFADSFSNADLVDGKKSNKHANNGSSKKQDKTKQVEKLIELANKKGYSKRKAREEEEAITIEKRLEKRKKLFTASNKNSEESQDDENTSKTETPNTKRNNLLNYFSKSTPEQLEKERQKNAKVTVKAEIHTPSSSPTSMAPVFEKKNKNSKKKKSKQQEDADEIVIIESETIVLSPKNEKLTSPTDNNKPKWSLKIQLQSNHVNSLADDEEIYTPNLPSKLQKENIKINDKKIPKVLLPIKNKKKESLSPINNNNIIVKDDKNEIQEMLINEKKNEKEHLKIDKEVEKSKTDKQELKTEESRKCSTEVDINETKGVCLNGMMAKKETADDDCHVVDENVIKKKQSEKIAPLFKKKSKLSAEVVAARRLFLQSDIKANTNNTEIRKLVSIGPSVLPFPKISHIKQLSTDNVYLNETYKFSLKNIKKIDPSYDLSHLKNISNFSNEKSISNFLFECVKSDIETVLSEVESYYSDASSLWKAISALTETKIPKKPRRGRRKVDKKDFKQSNDDLQNELLHSPWTDKYKPKNSANVVGNEEATLKLKSWLESWKSLKNNEDYSSGEEFYHSDSSMSSNLDNSQVAVLIGPHGCGKTASVYAVAQELGYKVLEVNASSKRPGKKILKDFEEATKSHRVKKSELKNMFMSALKKPEEPKQISENSLILMEDIDLVFEEDEGFVSAAFQLASNTKRPIVMTLRDTCFHLIKMAPQQLRINYEPVTGKRVIALMQLIALAEKQCNLSQNCIEVLCQSGDLRKSLLQLQYILLSGKEHISFNSLGVNNLSWHDMRIQIYKPAIKIDKKRKQMTDNEKSNDSALNDLANNLDNFTLTSILMNIEDPTLELLNIRSEPCISLVENMRCYSHLDSTSLEIGNWLNNSVKKLSLSESKKFNNQIAASNCQTLTKKQVIIGVDSALSQIASNTLDRRALAVDYLSSIRTICRAEEVRQQLNSKRGNRFFHYLQGSRLSNGSMKTGNILSAACKMLQEKSATVD